MRRRLPAGLPSRAEPHRRSARAKALRGDELAAGRTVHETRLAEPAASEAATGKQLRGRKARRRTRPAVGRARTVEVPGPNFLADHLGRFDAYGRVAEAQASFAKHRGPQRCSRRSQTWSLLSTFPSVRYSVPNLHVNRVDQHDWISFKRPRQPRIHAGAPGGRRSTPRRAPRTDPASSVPVGSVQMLRPPALAQSPTRSTALPESARAVPPGRRTLTGRAAASALMIWTLSYRNSVVDDLPWRQQRWCCTPSC
jgi:hypothetical protein